MPTASITPITSCPGTRGNAIPGQWPSLVIASLWQMPQAWTLIRTEPGPGRGSALDEFEGTAGAGNLDEPHGGHDESLWAASRRRVGAEAARGETATLAAF